MRVGPENSFEGIVTNGFSRSEVQKVFVRTECSTKWCKVAANSLPSFDLP